MTEYIEKSILEKKVGDRMKLMKTLQDNYGYNTPILLSEMNIVGVSAIALRQMMTRLVRKGSIERFAQGVYYIPTTTALGKSKIDVKKIYEKKYISSDEETYGYYTGLALANAVGLTTQMPNIIEIVTNNEKSRVREVQIGKQKLQLRKAKTTITRENAKVLQLLDLINKQLREKLTEVEKECIASFAKEQDITRDSIYQYISYFPSRVAKIVMESRLLDELR